MYICNIYYCIHTHTCVYRTMSQMIAVGCWAARRTEQCSVSTCAMVITLLCIRYVSSSSYDMEHCSVSTWATVITLLCNRYVSSSSCDMRRTCVMVITLLCTSEMPPFRWTPWARSSAPSARSSAAFSNSTSAAAQSCPCRLILAKQVFLLGGVLSLEGVLLLEDFSC